MIDGKGAPAVSHRGFAHFADGKRRQRVSPGAFLAGIGGAAVIGAVAVGMAAGAAAASGAVLSPAAGGLQAAGIMALPVAPSPPANVVTDTVAPGLAELPLPNAGVPATIAATARTFYVDFAEGKDSNSGTTTTKAWKHAPGDSAATGAAASTALRPGDVVRFRGGVLYRGSIGIRQSGTANQPITYSGTGFGTGRGIWDGADPVTSAVACPNQASCGGASNWRSLWLVTFPTPATSNIRIYDGKGPLFEAMTPTQPDPFQDDAVDSYVTIPVSQANNVAAGRIVDATLAVAARNEPNARIAIWNSGNDVVIRQILAVSGSTVLFDATGVNPYRDRDGKAAIVGALKAVTAPGLYAILAGTKAVVYPRPGAGSYFVGTGRAAFDLRGQSNIVIHGMDFTRGTAASGTLREGIVLANYGSRLTNVLFEGNRIYNFSLKNGVGALQLRLADNAIIRGNTLDSLESASGMRTGNINGLLIEKNIVRRIGRTGIYLQGVKDATVRGNIVSGIRSVHGNGMSVYLDNQDITVSGNCVFDSDRPLTFEGNGASTPVTNLHISGNVLVTTASGRAAISSWGANTRTVTIDNNVAIGSRIGMLLNTSDSNVRVTGNRTSGINIPGSNDRTPTGWVVSGNDNSALYKDTSAMALSTSSCSASGYQRSLAVRL